MAAVASGSPTGSRGGSGASTMSRPGSRASMAPTTSPSPQQGPSSSRDRPKGIQPSPNSSAAAANGGCGPPPRCGPGPGPRSDRPRSPELEVRPRVARDATGERRPDGAQGIVGTCPAAGEGRAEQLELGLQRPHADPEDDAAATGDVEGAVALHQLERVVVAEHHDVRQQPDGPCRGGHEAQGRERVPVPAAPGGGGGLGMATCSGHDTHSYPRRSAARATSTTSSMPPARSHAGGSKREFRFTTGVTMPRRTGTPPRHRRAAPSRRRRPSWRVSPPRHRSSLPRARRLPCGARSTPAGEEAPWRSTWCTSTTPSKDSRASPPKAARRGRRRPGRPPRAWADHSTAFYFAFGDSDAVVIGDFPDHVSAAALALAVGSGGGASVRTTVLVSPKEIDKAAKKQVTYQPPGG